uniref:Uncharacterized protein n=1 Tax=Chrysotila carterae TaxID=13221 RepID=A0A7S4F7K8_CHRCT|mmetsp:Transcript_9023/g.19553  ORF Transcript_9023/g.19553 Transcript_9023/m.19553 type:complete len:604 (+) Transcript_9023:351-2162(+)
MAPSKLCVWLIVVSVGAILSLILGYYLKGEAKTIGSLGRWYEVPTCHDWNIQSTEFSVFPIAHAVIQGDDSPCTLASAGHGAAVRIKLEQGDGFHAGARYSTVVMLGDQHYATASFGVEDANGATMAPTVNVELGPDINYPWRAIDFSDPSSKTVSSLSPPPPPPPSDSASEQLASAEDAANGRRLADAPKHADERAQPEGRMHALDEAAEGLEGAQAQARAALGEAGTGAGAAGAAAVSAWEAEQAAVDAALSHYDAEMNELDGWWDSIDESDEAFDDGADAEEKRFRMRVGGGFSSRRRSGGFGGFSRSSYSRSTSSSYSSSTRRSTTYSSATTPSKTGTTHASTTHTGATHAGYGSTTYTGTRGYYSGSRYTSYSGVTPHAYVSYPVTSHYYFSPTAYYYVGGYPYFMGGYPYQLSFFTHALVLGSVISLVHPHYYTGGYASAAGRAESYRLDQSQDQYKLSVGFEAPEHGGWPLFLVVHNATVFTSKQSAAAPIYMSFESSSCYGAAEPSDCATLGSVATAAIVIGYLLLAAAVIIACCMCNWSDDSDEEPIMVEQQVFYTSPFGGAPQQASRSQARDLHACDNTTFAPNILPYVRLAR